MKSDRAREIGDLKLVCARIKKLAIAGTPWIGTCVVACRDIINCKISDFRKKVKAIKWSGLFGQSIVKEARQKCKIADHTSRGPSSRKRVVEALQLHQFTVG